MSSRVTIFDHHMRPLIELQYPTERTWVLNDVGKCNFNISTSDSICKLEYLEYGNLIHIEHIPSKDEDGTLHGQLPNWTGIILRGRVWSPGNLAFTAYSAESILMIRPMPWITIKGSPKTMFNAILDEIAALNTSIVIHPGIVEDSGIQLMDILRLSAYEHIVKLQKMARMNWSITGNIDVNGNLLLYANLFSNAGYDTQMELNNLNSHMENTLLTEEGTPRNVIIGYSQASTQRGRYNAAGINEVSLGKFGYFGTNQTFMGLQDPSSIKQAAQNIVDIFGEPSWIASRSALDIMTTFDHLQVGNIVRIQERQAGFHPQGGLGFNTNARILNMNYNDLTNEVSMELEIF